MNQKYTLNSPVLHNSRNKDITRPFIYNVYKFFSLKGLILFDKRIILLLAILGTSTFSASSERDILLQALSNNNDIKLTRSQMTYDSLSLKAARTGWLPQLSFSLSPGITLLDTSSDLTTKHLYDSLRLIRDTVTIDYLQTINNLDPAGKINGTVKVDQPIRGGATLSAAYTNESSKIWDRNSSNYNNSFQLSVNQPLLNSAWKFSDPFYSITIQTIENKQVSLEGRKTILSTLSSVRTLFWDYYAQISDMKTYEQDINRTLEQMQSTRVRFSIGDASTLDTLSALYDYNNAQQKLLDSDISARQARNKLALALAIQPESLSISDSISPDVPDLPDPGTIISLAKQYDPSLKIFDRISEKLLLEKKKSQNSLLPSLNATASMTFGRSGTYLFSNDNFSNNAVVGLVFSYALPQKKNSISIKQATLKIEDNITNQKKYENELNVKLLELIDSWHQEKQRIILAEKSKQIAELQFIAAEKEYKLGTIERLSLLDAQNKLVNSQLSLTQTKIEMKKLEIILDEITGTLFQRFNLNVN